MGLRGQGTHPVDRHVGARMRLLRIGRRWSQSALAAKLGVSFQAVQKYEAGTARISVGRLYDAAHALGATPGSFFEGYGEDAVEPLPGPPAPGRRDMASLLSGYARIRDPQLRSELRRLIASLGEDAG